MTDEDEAPPDAPDAPAEAPKQRSVLATLFTPKGADSITDSELRNRMRTLDRTERKWGYGAAGFVLVLSLLLLPSLLHDTYGPPDEKPTGGTCAHPSTFKLVAKTCATIFHPSAFYLEFALFVVVGGVLLYAVWRSKRALTIFTAFFIGLAALFAQITLVFVLGMALGAWLLARSWRLQRYGSTNSKEVRKIMTERSEVKRAAKRDGKQDRRRDHSRVGAVGPHRVEALHAQGEAPAPMTDDNPRAEDPAPTDARPGLDFSTTWARTRTARASCAARSRASSSSRSPTSWRRAGAAGSRRSSGSTARSSWRPTTRATPTPRSSSPRSPARFGAGSWSPRRRTSSSRRGRARRSPPSSTTPSRSSASASSGEVPLRLATS